jgi:arylsulfatase A-like enzyme
VTRRRALVALVLVAAAGLVLHVVRRDEFDLPSRLVLEHTVRDLSATFERAAVVEESPTTPVRLGGVQPSRYFDGDGPYRQAIVAPARSRLRFRTPVPAGALLRFGIGIEGAGRRDTSTAGTRFTVAVDGREAFSRVLNPASRRKDRHWFDEAIDLGVDSERPVEITLTTSAEGTGPLRGTPGWSHVRIVSRTWRDRIAAGPEAPSVLVLLVDTLRADQLGCYGARPSPSPALDRLAAEGVLFEHSIAQASWTMPSVATLLTGLYPASHGVVAGSHPGAAQLGFGGDVDPAFLSGAIPTLAESAVSAGITTAGVSGNPIVSRATNLARGFETFVEFGWDRERKHWPAAERINETFLAWLARNRQHRFLAYLHYMDVHDPYRPPEEFRPRPPDGARPRVISGDVAPLALKIRHGEPPLPAPEVAHLRALYDGEIRYWDGELGKLLAGVGDLGVRDSTVVVVTADHGEEFQEHGKLKHGIHLYDELLRVPLVLSGPGVGMGIGSGRRVPDQVQGIDFFPTVARLLGLSVPAGLPGQDLLGARLAARPAFSETRYGVAAGSETPLFSLRTAAWKLIEAPALGHFELYDLARDPAEQEDRYAGTPEAAGLVGELAHWRASAPPPPVVEASDPNLRAKLRALGYVE